MSVIPEELIHKILMHSYLLDYPQREDLSSRREDTDRNCFEYRLIGFPLDEKSPNDFSELPTFLKLRQLNKRWRTVVDTFLKIIWKDLSYVKPLTSVNIAFIMSDVLSRESSIVKCFQRLTLYFINAGAEIGDKQNHMSIRIYEYRILQDKAQDAQDISLQIIWKNKIKEFFPSDSRPADDASATDIRGFLNNYVSTLKGLNLSQLNLTTFPMELTLFKSLTHLDISKNRLKQLPASLNLANLDWLDLSDNQLQELPASLNFPKLRTLNLLNNQLIEFPASLNLSNLSWLNLSSNRLKEVPVSLNLPNLSWLNLSYNRLKEFPASLNLSKLRTLNLYQNQLQELSVSLNCPNLEALDLSDNQLKEFPESLNFFNLISIKLDNNLFIFISDKILNRFPCNICIKSFISQLDCSPKSVLSKLCHAIMRKAPLKEQKELFFLLDLTDRNAIYECIWKKGGSLNEWEEKNAFDDMVRFRFAVHERIMEKLKGVPEKQKTSVILTAGQHFLKLCDLCS